MDFFALKNILLNCPLQFKTRQQLWHHCLSMVQPGDMCMEFGVWYGGSVNYMARVRPDNTFHGFDSFEGLPEDWIRGHPKGHFKVDREKLKFEPNVTLHEGLFSDTIPTYMAEGRDDYDKVKLIHIDCDLGSSCDTILAGLEPLLTIAKPLLLFDEFYNYLGFEEHEFLSFLKFIERTGADFEILARNVKHQQALIQLR